MRKHFTIFSRLFPALVAATALCTPAHAGILADDATCAFLYFKDGSVEAFPTEYLKDLTTSGGQVRLTLVNDSVIVRNESAIDSISSYGPEMPSFTSFKFNNKFNDDLPFDVEPDTLTDYMSFDVPAIGRRLTPSFKLSDDSARVYVDGVEQHSKESRRRFDADVVYTVALPGCSSLTRTTVQEEVWTEEIWSEEVWSEPVEEISLKPDMLSTNQPSNNPDSEGLAMLLDGNKGTFFQSTWGTGAHTQKSENVVLDVALPCSLHTFSFYYCTRAIDNYNPLAFRIWASNDGAKWDYITELTTADGLPESYGNAEFTSEPITLGASYTHLRFELTNAEHKKKQADGFELGYMALAEFRITKISERELIKPSELIQEASYQPAIYTYQMSPYYGRNYTVHVNWLTEGRPVPNVYVDIDGGQMVSSKDYYLHANFRIEGNGVYEDLVDSVWIKGRGNSSWAGEWGKSPYRLKFDEKIKPFGLTKGKSWCLIANAQTGSMMANAIGMKAARMIGTQGACHIIPVELYINGEYRGSYTFTEKVGISNNSIDIDESTGYMLELDDYFDEVYKFRSSAFTLPVNVKEPDLTEEPYVYKPDEWFYTIQDEFNTFESAVYSKTDYENMMDLDAFARFFLVNDLVNNMELGHPKSTFLYKEIIGDPNSRYMFGPVWDLDWAFGYENTATYYQSDATSSIFSKMTGQTGNNFFQALFNNSEYVRKAYYRVWVEFMTKYYKELLEFPTDYYAFAKDSYLHNADRWGDGGSYDQSLERIANWLDTRTTWIMDNIEVFPLDEDDPVYIVRGDVNGDGVLTPADIVCLVGYLIGQESDDFNAKQADIDRSGEITITDLVLDIDLVLMAQNAASAPAIRRQSPAEQRLVLNAFEAHLGETSTVRVQLLPVEEADEDVRYTACSFVVCLPEGMTLDDVTLSSARSTHHVAMSRLDERHTRVLLYSDANAPLPLGDMVRLAVRPESVLKTNERLVVLNDVLLTTADGDDHRVHAATTTFDLGTGIDATSAVVRIEGGDALTVTTLESLPVAIYTADGRLVQTLVVAPGTTTVALPAGIYVVNNTKVIIY